ncbi:MAG: MBL fold metallo-hydrolase [Kiritimatiellae bacterium]|jgi:hydroxyacylglutathione hydrolase|nr:MBL fold metallo-hydrolase [Kiritimatiellia bacterium]
MKIDKVITGEFQVNCFIIHNDGEAIIIDPGDDVDLIDAKLKELKLTPVLYIQTHGHMDHISALAELQSRFQAPVYMAEEDAKWAFTDINCMPPFFPAPPNSTSISKYIKDGDEFNFAGMNFRIIKTPGHTPGSLCIYFYEDNSLFSGDTVFAGSVGRTDLPGGDSRILTESLKKLLKAIPNSTRIYTGHGPATTMDLEKRNNFYFQNISVE